MAFSTQKDFMKVEFLTGRLSNKEDGKQYRALMKTYSSCTDSRAWSLSKESQTKYLHDLMCCGGMSFTEEGGGDGSEDNLLSSGRTRRPFKSTEKKNYSMDGIDDIAATSRRKFVGATSAGLDTQSERLRDKNSSGFAGIDGKYDNEGYSRMRGNDAEGSEEFGPETTWSGTVGGNPEYSDLKSVPPVRSGPLPQQAVKPNTRIPGISLPVRGSTTGGGRVVIVAPVTGIRGSKGFENGSFHADLSGKTSNDDFDKNKIAVGVPEIGSRLSHSKKIDGLGSGSDSMMHGQRDYPGLAGDSLIEAACIQLDGINAIVRENGELKKQLQYSKEKFQSLDEANCKMKAIISDSNVGSLAGLEDELKALNANGDFNSENVLKVLQSYINDFQSYNQKVDIMRAENDSLKRQLVKLEARIEICPLPTKQDLMITDVNQLRLTVNDLRNEVIQLRAIEEDRARLQVEFDNLKKTIKGIGSPEDLYHIRKNSAALREVKCDRDRLRHLVNSMVGIENEIRTMKVRAGKTEQLEMQLAALQAEVENNGVDGGRPRDTMQREIDQLKKEKEDAQQKLESILPPGMDESQLQEHFKDYDRASCELHVYKIHYNELINELRTVSTRLLQLEPELQETKQRLNVAESAMSSYERQMDELMSNLQILARHLLLVIEHYERLRRVATVLLEVIRELEDNRCVLLDDGVDSGTASKMKDGHIQDLLTIAKVIILFIQKETEARANLEDELTAYKNEISQLSEISTIDKEVEYGLHGMKLANLQKDLEACCKAREGAEQENRALRSQISNEDIEDLLDQLNACKRENQRLQAMADVSLSKDSKDFENIFDELSNYRTQASAINAEKSRLSSKVDELQQLLDASENANETFAEIEGKQNMLEPYRCKIAELEEQVARLTSELENCLEKYANEVSDVRKQLADNKVSLGNQLEAAYDNQNNDQKNELQKLSKCEKEIVKLKEQLMQQIATSQIENDEIQDQVKRLDSEKEILVSERISGLEKLLAECRNENHRLQKEQITSNTQLTKNLAEMNKLREELNSQAEGFEEEKMQLSDGLTKVTGEVNHLNSALSIEKQGSKTFAEDCEKTKAALRDLTDKYKQLESRYDSLQQHDTSIEKGLVDLRKEYENQTLKWNKEINEQKGLLGQAKASLESQRHEISRLNDVLNQSAHKDQEVQLESIMAENIRLKSENQKLQTSIELKEKEIGDLNNKVNDIAIDLDKYGEELKATDCTQYKDETVELKNIIAKHIDEIKTQENLLNGLRSEVSAAKAAKLALESKLAELKSDKEVANEHLKREPDKLQSEVLLAETIVLKETSQELSKCLAENSRLQVENQRLQDEFKQLGSLVKNIEEEREKNRQLEAIIEDFERKINDLQNQPATVVVSTEINIEKLVDKLKEQLQNETNKNNALEAELHDCKAAVIELNHHHDAGETNKTQWMSQETTNALKLPSFVGDATKLSEAIGSEVANRASIAPTSHASFTPSTISRKASTGRIGLVTGHVSGEDKTNAMFTYSINEIKSNHCENLEKMQQVYEEQMKDMLKNHEREIQSLRLTNEALRKMLEDIKAQLAALGGTIATKSKHDDQAEKERDSIETICGFDKKLKKICTKVIKNSIGCLSLRELKYLHCAVYRAGVKMKSTYEVFSPKNIGRCCECTGFMCCLPSIPKNAEKKFIERINSLENELESANELLKRLRDRYEFNSGCNRRYCSSNSERRIAPARGINDAVNQILKCAREGRRNSNF